MCQNDICIMNKVEECIQLLNEDLGFQELVKLKRRREAKLYPAISSLNRNYRYLVLNHFFGKVRDERGGRADLRNPIFWDEFTAYFMGYLLGDGNLWKRENQEFSYISVASADFDIIKKLQEELSGDLNIRPYRSSRSSKDTYILRFKSGIWESTIREFGIVENKSLKVLELRYPTGDNFRHFVRGLFDSDGCVCYYNTKSGIQPIFALLGGLNYCYEISDKLPFKLNKGWHNKVQKVSTGALYTIAEAYTYLYEGSTIWMDRKRKIFEYIKCYAEKKTW